MTASRMGAGELIASYKQQWHVEQSGCISKHDLRARPVFHHQRGSIGAPDHGHSLTGGGPLPEDANGLSIKKVIRTLRSIQTAQIHLAGQTITASHPITTQAILDTLSLEPED